jgi:hypothetical protein
VGAGRRGGGASGDAQFFTEWRNVQSFGHWARPSRFISRTSGCGSKISDDPGGKGGEAYDFGESDPHGNRRMRVTAGENMQYLKSRFTVTGEMSKTAQDNYRKGYAQIDWSSNGKSSKEKKEDQHR